MFILSFSISFVYLVVILLILCAILLWDSARTHSPSGKELNPSSQEDARFQGVAPRHTIFTLSCVIPLWDSATAHSPSGKELNTSSQEGARFSELILSSLEESCFSGLIVLLISSHYPAWALFGLVLTHIIL